LSDWFYLDQFINVFISYDSSDFIPFVNGGPKELQSLHVIDRLIILDESAEFVFLWDPLIVVIVKL
jgi:hypothetical protein